MELIVDLLVMNLLSAAGDHRVWWQDGDRRVSFGHHCANHPEHSGVDHQCCDARLCVHEDGAGQPPSRDAHLLKKRRYRFTK